VNNAAGDSLYSPYWEFGDPASGPSNISYLYNPTHLFTAPGLYVVKFRAVNSNNCVDSVYRMVLIRALPAPAFTFETIPCDSTIYFTDGSTVSSGSILYWIWDYGDGSPVDTIFAPGPGDTSHLYVNTGFYNVILKVVNSYGCSDTISHVVQRYPCVLASFTYSDTLMCARYPISFSDSSLPIDKITQWHWYFGDGTDSVYTTHTGNIVHTYTDSGTYVVKLKINATVLAATFTDSIVQTVTIHPTPITYFSNQGVCLNQITLFRDTSNTFGKGIKEWNWNFGDPSSVPNDTSTFKNPTHKYDTAGSYDVKLVVMNRWGCKDSLTKSTRVFTLPVASFDNSVACSGNPTYFADNSVTLDTTIMAWGWNFGVAGTTQDTADIEDPVYQYKTEGDYLVRLVVMDHNGCLDTIDSTIRVNITPVSAFTLTDNLEGMTGRIQLNNLSSGATSYEWEFGNGTSSVEENPVATYTFDGTYVITLISLNQFNCTDTTYYKYKVLFKGLYIPNAFSPTNTNLAVRLFKPVGKNMKQYNIQVYDSWGHMVWESNKLDNEGRPLEGWDGNYNGTLMPQGTYMWKASATFIDDTIWQGSDIGKGEFKTMGTVSLIR
jgi:large repetitive protein